jgi:hypothetical protein
MDALLAEWLGASSDPSFLHQLRRDLLRVSGVPLETLRRRIGREGWAKELFDRRGQNGHWGRGPYNPKWTCTHYVLYELVQLGIDSGNEACRESLGLLWARPRGRDGGINYARTVEVSDVCINGMLLTMGSHFGLEADMLGAEVDYLLSLTMPDGGWNCEYYHGARHSSLHTTISVLEGLWAYLDAGHEHPRAEQAADAAVEYILRHELYKTRTTGEIIKDEFLKFCFPIRWKYDILRCLDLFRRRDVPFDPRMKDAIEIIEGAADPSGRWRAASQPGATYFVVEKNGAPGRWNTLRALRVLERYGDAAQRHDGTEAGQPKVATRRRKTK